MMILEILQFLDKPRVIEQHSVKRFVVLVKSR